MADHNTLIGSATGEIEGGTVLIGGVVREIESGLVLVNGVAREIEFRPQMFTVEITGSGNYSHSYVIINGTRYTASATVEVESGSIILAHASVNSDGTYKATIKLNGTTVKESTMSCEYQYTVTGNVGISLGYMKSPQRGSVSITEK